MRRLLGLPLKGAAIEHAYPPEVMEQMVAEFSSRLKHVQSTEPAMRKMATKSIRPKAIRDKMVGLIRKEMPGLLLAAKRYHARMTTASNAE